MTDLRTVESDETSKKLKETTKPTDNSLENESGSALKKNQLNVVPAQVKKSYIKVNEKYFFIERPETMAFEDRGHRIKTPLSNANVTSSMMDIAEAKGWTAIKITGKDAFRREAWLQATVRGLTVKGYSPKEEDLARLKKIAQERSENDNKERPDPVKEEDKQLKKIEKELSEDDNKERPGPVKEEEEFSERTRPLTETKDLTEVVKTHPQLLQEVAILKLGEKFSQKLPDHADRKRFMDRLRERVANLSQNKQEPQPIRIKEEQTITRQQEVENEGR